MYLSRFILAALCLASVNQAASINTQESTGAKVCDLQFNMFYWKFTSLQKYVSDLEENHHRLNKSQSQKVKSLVDELQSQMVATQSKCCFSHNSPDDGFDPDQLVIFKGFTRSMTGTSQEIVDDFKNDIPLYNDKLNTEVINDMLELKANLTDLDNRCFAE
ncbi:hypothetical protein A0J61_04078 [Choanephora cucurbitarum]|uniref:Uncharacterized protein n=1 Tax=Choanephora cucurbitarum TaxID=101091 RepID=A0A1C7NH56_9FUNG|nr:hypothetical protein A0J61_04078 [Choanephora cucurbitarum]